MSLSTDTTGDRWDRVARIQRDRWAPNPVSDHAVQRAKLAICSAGRIRSKAILFWGVPNAGKSALRIKILREMADWLMPLRNRAPVVIIVECPSEADEARFYEAILQGAHRYIPKGNVRTLHQAVTAFLDEVKPDVMILDEAGNLNAYTGVRGAVCLHAIRRLCNVHSMAMLGFGTAAAMTALQADEQLENRFEIHELRPLAPGEFAEFLDLLTGAMPLAIETTWTTAMLERAYELTQGYVGRSAYLVQEAAIEAVLGGDEQITAEILNSDGIAASLAALEHARRTAGGRTRRRSRRAS